MWRRICIVNEQKLELFGALPRQIVQLAHRPADSVVKATLHYSGGRRIGRIRDLDREATAIQQTTQLPEISG
jgi:hypothetical protein